jgi:ubiquinone/menaquinone biosynthesis C-methylase UbiE
MLCQAMKRNAAAISEDRIELHEASADHMPFEDARPDALAGLREVSRVLRDRGQLALAFTSYSGQRREGVAELVASAGFGDCRVVETDQAFCVLASATSRT